MAYEALLKTVGIQNQAELAVNAENYPEDNVAETDLS